MSWEEDEKEKGWTRREWVRLSLTAGALGSIGALGGLVTGQILPPPIEFRGEIRESMQYTKFITPQWWNARAGTSVKPADFAEWQGATGVWRGLFQDGVYVPGTGLPVLIIRVKREDALFSFPEESELPDPVPEGFSLFYDDPDLDAANGGTRIVVLFDRCVHLCCYPGWHVVFDPPPQRDYVAPAPTYEEFNQDPVYCVCHGSQYDPMALVVDLNTRNAARYVGALRVHGPALRALPVIPVKLEAGALVGGMPNPAWYVYC